MNTRWAVSLPVPPNVPASLALVRTAESYGYESVWIAETSGPDAFALAAAVATTVARMRIGTAVVPAYTRTPAVLAAAAGTIEQLAPGRFILGIGASSEAIVEQWSGVPFRKPLARVRETVEVVRRMLAGERPEVDGTTLRTRGFRLTSPPTAPLPIYVAGLMPAMLEIAGQYGDGAILNFFPVEALPRMIEHLAAGARRAGRDFDQYEVVCRFQVCVTDDPAGVRRMLRGFLAPYFATTVYNRFIDWCGFHDEARQLREGWAARDRGKTEAAVHDEMIDRIAIIGSAEACREKIAAFVRSGITTPMISPIVPVEPALDATLGAFAPALGSDAASR